MPYQQYPIVGPFKGIWDATPRPHIPKEAFDDAVNIFFRKGRIQSRPKLNSFPAAPDNYPFYNIVTFADVTGAVHTLGLTTYNAYLLGAGPAWTLLTYPSGITSLGGTYLPHAIGALNNRIYFANGSNLVLYSDGSSALKVASANGTTTGANVVPGSARYMAVNKFHLITANTTEPVGVGAIRYPARVRWAMVGNPNNWDDLTAGFEDLSEVVDFISGCATLGRNTFIWRTNGLSLMAPTGIGVQAFEFDLYSYSTKGLGNPWPYGLSVYGNRACWPGHDDIYAFNGQEIKAIGTNAKKKIFKDLENATDINSVKTFQIDRMSTGFDFNSLWLSIAGPDITWVYNFDEGNWTRFKSSSGALTCIATVAVA